MFGQVHFVFVHRTDWNAHLLPLTNVHSIKVQNSMKASQFSLAPKSTTLKTAIVLRDRDFNALKNDVSQNQCEQGETLSDESWEFAGLQNCRIGAARLQNIRVSPDYDSRSSLCASMKLDYSIWWKVSRNRRPSKSNWHLLYVFGLPSAVITGFRKIYCFYASATVESEFEYENNVLNIPSLVVIFLKVLFHCEKDYDAIHKLLSGAHGLSWNTSYTFKNWLGTNSWQIFATRRFHFKESYTWNLFSEYRSLAKHT